MIHVAQCPPRILKSLKTDADQNSSAAPSPSRFILLGAKKVHGHHGVEIHRPLIQVFLAWRVHGFRVVGRDGPGTAWHLSQANYNSSQKNGERRENT